MGHSQKSYTRYAFAVLSNTNGNVNLPSSSGYDYYAHFSQAIELPRLGVQRFGVFGYAGQAPTYFRTAEGEPIAGAGLGNKSFYRAGVYGLWSAGKFDLSTVYMHGHDNAFLAAGTRADQPLPDGARAATWNGGFAELHYNVHPQLIFIGRYELIRMANQAFPAGTLLESGRALTSDFGNLNSYVFGYRWYPIMTSRGGLAWHQEYAWTRTVGTAPISGLNATNKSYMMGLDLAF